MHLRLSLGGLAKKLKQNLHSLKTQKIRQVSTVHCTADKMKHMPWLAIYPLEAR